MMRFRLPEDDGTQRGGSRGAGAQHRQQQRQLQRKNLSSAVQVNWTIRVEPTNSPVIRRKVRVVMARQLFIRMTLLIEKE